MKRSPMQIYRARVSNGVIKPDAAQEGAAGELDRLYVDILETQGRGKPSLLQRIAGYKDESSVRGVYLHGGVGRGKTMLMDLFYDCLPDDIPKRRVHFHEFMIEVHDYIHSRKEDDSVKGIVDQALPSLAALIARKSKVLCFDEFHVTDIADAMILGRLFKILFEMDIIVVATSNRIPDDLYKDGLQRERFLPFIALLKERVAVVHLDSPHDYRKQHIPVEGTYFTPDDDKAAKAMDRVYKQLAAQENASNGIENNLKVKGRQIVPDKATGGLAYFTFARLCEKPLGAEDYIAIAKAFHTVLIAGVPALGHEKRNEAKRFMHLIDALYEGRVRVILSAQGTPDEIYAGRDHAFEFERTISRLREMQGKDWP